MDLVEATQVLCDEAPSSSEDEARVGTLKIGSQTHIIRRGVNRVGRSPQCRVVINNVTVSKVHAEIQAGAEAAFVSDLRSSNGTKIKDVPLKPFYYYSINDGDAIYFGQVKAVYATARSTATEDVLLVPETPVAPRNRNATERFSTGAGNIPESFLNNSSVYESDTSMIPGTQETERKRPTFQRPSTPVQRSPSSRTVEAASNGSKSGDAGRKSDIDGTTTRNDVEVALQPPGAKRPRLQERNAPDSESNIHEAETQAMPSPIAKRKEPAQPRHSDNIFEAETQRMPIAMSEKRTNQDDIFEAETPALPVVMGKKKILEDRENQDDIFEAETQALPVAMGKKKMFEDRQNRDDIFEAETQILPVSMSENRKNLDDIFEAETQALPVAVGKKKIFEGRRNRDDIFEAETQAMEVSIPDSRSSIYEAETQAMEISVSKSGEKIAKRPRVKILEAINRPSSGRAADSIHEAETQMAQVQIAVSESVEPIGIEENIHGLATQILDKNRSSTAGSIGRMNETVESSFRSNSSRDRLRLSTTSPSSPENVEIEESQNLLEIIETPLLAYEKSCEKISSIEDVPVACEESKIGEKKSRVFRRVRTIPESSESETDDEKVSPRFVRKSKPSNVIEDSSEEATDEENVFGGSPLARAGQEGASTRNAGSAAAKGLPDSSKARCSPLRTRKSDERDSDGGGKEDVSMSGDSPTDSARRNDGILRTDVDGRLLSGHGESGDSLAGFARSDAPSTKKIGETLNGKMGRSSAHLLGRKDRDSATKNGGEALGAKANLLGDSPSGDENSPKKFDAASTSKFGRSPLRLPRKGNRDSPKKNEQEAPGRGGAKSHLFGDFPRINDVLPKNQGESPERPKNAKKSGDVPGRTNDASGKMQAEKSAKFQPRSNMFGRPSLCLSRKGGDPSPKRITEKSTKEEEDDIFEASTQRVVYDSVGNASAAPKVDPREGPATGNDEIDIDLLPTQILDVPSSTPLSQRSKYRKNRAGLEQLNGDDLHSAPTQILKDSPRSENTDDHEQFHGKDLQGVPSRIVRKSPRRGNADADRNKTNDGGKMIDLDDSLATNLGNLLGEEANNDCLDDEGTQLMTQNLVDILRPTQSFSEDTSERKSSPRTSVDNFGRGSNSPARGKIYAPGTLGFVDGEARNSSRELVSADSSPIKAARENKEIAAPSARNDEPEPSAHLVEDDIFLGLPEVRICGTLSNPGSPSSSSSSLADFPPQVRSSKKRMRNPTNRSDSPDSPITPKKSRVTKRSASSYKILEDALDDSDEDFDYLDLKRMADRLLASDSRCEGKSRRATTRSSVNDKFAKIPVPIARKSDDRKKIGEPKRRAVKLSGGPSSSAVSDVKDETTSFGSADSSGETRKSGRRRKPAGAPATSTVAVIVPLNSKKEQGGEESQEVEAILGKVVEDNQPMVSRKSYAKMKMAKRNVEAKYDGAVAETPKATRKRRTVSVARTVQETPVVTPSRTRRTIAGAPGILGDDEERKILFTGVRDDKYDRIVAKLGGTVVSDPSEATVLITDKVRRTFKFLCAVARGIRVVSINWLLESGKSSRFLDCERFILKEAAAEAKYKFSLEKSLQIARTKKLLDGYTIIVTPKVNQPEIHELKGMVEACGGRLLVRPGRNWSAKTVIISREEDYAVAKACLAKAPKNLKITVQSTEFILTGILRQEVNLVEHELKFV